VSEELLKKSEVARQSPASTDVARRADFIFLKGKVVTRTRRFLAVKTFSGGGVALRWNGLIAAQTAPLSPISQRPEEDF